MERYSMIGTPGGWREYEADDGEWVRYKDVERLIDLCHEFVNEKSKTQAMSLAALQRMAE